MLHKFDGNRPVVGNDAYISELASVIGDVVIGDKCYIGHGAIIRGDYGRIEIGEGTAVEEGVIIHAFPQDTCRIGRKVTIGHGAVVHGKEICDLAVIGMGAILSWGSLVGESSVVGEGSVVTAQQEIPPRVVAVGNPATILREISAKDEEFWVWGKQVYVDLAKKYLTQGMEPVDE